MRNRGPASCASAQSIRIRTCRRTCFPNDLLGKHFAVIGTTGSGKSCAVALILQAILNEHPSGHVVLLDPHAEYATAFGEMASVWMRPHSICPIGS